MLSSVSIRRPADGDQPHRHRREPVRGRVPGQLDRVAHRRARLAGSSSAPGSDLGRDGVSATDRQIGALQERLRQQPDDHAAATRLGLAYLQRARETSDPTYYTRADGILNQALDGRP